MLPTPRFSATAQDTPALELFRFIANDLGDQSLHCAELIGAREQPSLSTRSSLPLPWMCGTVLTVEHFFTCPSCGEEISMVLDLSVDRHTYVEDCEVCCNPLEISYAVEDDDLAHFEVKRLE